MSCWGLAKSKDLVTWQDCAPAIVNGTETEYDSCGVFSGSIISKLVDGQRVLYLFYTSIGRFPFPHWSVPYVHGETQSVAVSSDFGRTWQRYQNNPLLKGSPAKDDTTGWRDPFVSEWPALSKLRGVQAATKYMLLSSGDKTSGPQLHIYESENIFDLNWRYLSCLVQGQNDTPMADGSPLYFGRNFECGSFCTLGDRHYILAGVEQHPSQTDRHMNRYTVWLGGDLGLNSEGKPVFTTSSFGALDPGILYAPHIFRGPDNEVLQMGWADEENNSMTMEQGWAGCITLPRELVTITRSITDQQLKNKHLWRTDYAKNTMTTLGIRPAAQTSNLRLGARKVDLNGVANLRSSTFELEARFAQLTGSEVLTFNVRRAPNDREVTRIIISLAKHTITVDRSKSSLVNGKATPERGHFQLMKSSNAHFEDLQIRIFVDNSIVEVYANDRFALTARIYPTLDTALGVSCDFRSSKGGESLDRGKVAGFACWDRLVKAWPGRHVEEEDVEAVNGKTDLTEVHISEPHVHVIAA